MLSTSKILKVENEGYKTYTFKIIKNVHDNKYFENFVVVSKNGVYDFYVYQYSFNENLKAKFPYNIVKKKVDKNTLNIPSISKYLSREQTCGTAIEIEVAGEEHTCNCCGRKYIHPTCPSGYITRALYETVVTYLGPCGGGSSGGGSFNDDDGNQDHGDSDCADCYPHGGGPAIGVIPIDEFPDDPDCEKLKDTISNVPLIKQRLKDLRNVTGNFEKGLRINKNPTTNDYVPSPLLSGKSGERFISIRVDAYTVVIVHKHPDNGVYDMFSGNDIIKMGQNVYRTASNSNINPMSITHMLITSDRTFALRFDNPLSAEKLKNIYSNIDNRNKFIKKLNNAYGQDQKPQLGKYTDISKQQHRLFDFLKTANLGISLYEANYDSNGYVEGWQKINKENLTKEPCI